MTRSPRSRSEVVSRGDQGASPTQTNMVQRLTGWWRHHLTMARDSLQRLLDRPWSSVMTWLVIGIALALPVSLSVLVSGAESVSRNWDSGAQLSVFLKHDLNTGTVNALAGDIEDMPEVSSVRGISPAEALAEFESFSGFGDALRNLDSNPLPHLLLITPAQAAQTSEQIGDLSRRVSSLVGVDQVVVDMEWVERLRAMMALGKRAVLALGTILALGVLLIIGNTIRLTVESRRDEIVVVKLVGGSDAFVRRPFLYTGLWYGLGGALVAWALVVLVLFWLEGPLSSLAEQYQSAAMAPSLGVLGALQLLLFGGTLGLLGAWVTVSRHLASIEPR